MNAFLSLWKKMSERPQSIQHTLSKLSGGQQI